MCNAFSRKERRARNWREGSNKASSRSMTKELAILACQAEHRCDEAKRKVVQAGCPCPPLRTPSTSPSISQSSLCLPPLTASSPPPFPPRGAQGLQQATDSNESCHHVNMLCCAVEINPKFTSGTLGPMIQDPQIPCPVSHHSIQRNHIMMVIRDPHF